MIQSLTLRAFLEYLLNSLTQRADYYTAQTTHVSQSESHCTQPSDRFYYTDEVFLCIYAYSQRIRVVVRANPDQPVTVSLYTFGLKDGPAIITTELRNQ